MKAWIDGTVTDASEARIPIMDHGVLYGDGVFEGIRCYGGKIADFDLHVTRLRNSARAIFLAPRPEEELRRAVFETLQALGAPDAYIRLVHTRGTGALGIDISSCPESRLFCVVGDLAVYSTRREGIAMATASIRRPPPDVLDPRVKSLNYINNIMAKVEAKQRGAQEALVLNQRGLVAEASAANVFCVVNGTLTTPPATDGALEGITRWRVLQLAKQCKIPHVERSLSRYDVLAAQAVFLTGTGAGLVQVSTLDGIELGRDESMFLKLSEANKTYVRNQGTPVPGIA